MHLNLNTSQLEERVKLELAVEMAQRNLMMAIQSLGPNIPIERLQHEIAEFGQEMFRLGWTQGRLGMQLADGVSEWNGTIDNNNTTALAHGPPIWSPANSFLFAMSVVSRIGLLFLMSIFADVIYLISLISMDLE